MWRLVLADGALPRLDRPAMITLSNGLTVGRGDADILLDSACFPNLISRVHATVFLDPSSRGPIIENHSINLVRLEGRTGEDLKPNKNLNKDKRALLTDGCTVIFGSTGSRDEFAYMVRRIETAAEFMEVPDGEEACSHDLGSQAAAVREAWQDAELEAEAEVEAANADKKDGDGVASQAASQAVQAEEAGVHAGTAVHSSQAAAGAAVAAAAAAVAAEREVEYACCSAVNSPACPEPFDDDDEDVLVSSLASPAARGVRAGGQPEEAANAKPKEELPQSAPADAAAAAERAPKKTTTPDEAIKAGKGGGAEVAAPSAAQPPASASAGAASQPASQPASPSAMPLRELKAVLRARGVDFEGCIEKSELTTLYRQTSSAQSASAPPSAATPPDALRSDAGASSSAAAAPAPSAAAAAARSAAAAAARSAAAAGPSTVNAGAAAGGGPAAPPAAASVGAAVSAPARTGVQIHRINSVVIPSGVHLTINTQPSLLTEHGRPTLATLCAIMDLAAGATVDPKQERSAYLRP